MTTLNSLSRILLVAFLALGLVFWSGILGSSALDQALAASSADLLTGDRLQSCLQKEKTIKKRNLSMLSIGAQTQTKLNTIYDRVNDYYKKRIHSSARAIPDHELLHIAVTTNKEAVDKIYHQAREDVDLFSCVRAEPHDHLGIIHDDLTELKDSLEEYRSVVRKYVQAVYLAADPS